MTLVEDGRRPAPVRLSRPAPGRRLLVLPSWLCWALPGLLTLAACLVEIGSRPVWRDEEASWAAARLPLPELWRLVQHVDFVLAPYYLLLHGWIAVFGDGPTALRLPSALAMAGAGALLGALGRRLLGSPGAGLRAGLLFAVTPTVARYGQEARPYAFAMLFALLATLLLTRRQWLGYSAALVCCGGAHAVTLTILAAHAAYVWQSGRGERRRWAAAVAAAVALLSPLLWYGHRQGGQIAWNHTTWPDAAAMPYMLFRSPAVCAAVLAGVVALLRSALRRAVPADRRPSRPETALLALWALLPPAVTLLTTDALHLFLPRYLLFTVPAWALAAAYGWGGWGGWPGGRLCGRLRGRALLGAGLVLLGLALLSRPGVVLRNDPSEPAYRPVARAVLAGYRPGDGVAYAGHRQERRAMAYWWRNTPPKARPAELPAGAGCAAQPTGPPRVWLVSTAAGGGPYRAMPACEARALRSRYRVERIERFPNVRLLLLVARGESGQP